MSSLYVEIIDKNRSYYKCTICGRKLSKKQRLKTHLSCVPYHKPITILNAITNRNLPSFLQEKDATLGIIRNNRKFPVYQYQNQQSLIVTSVQHHVPTQPSRFLSLSFPLNLKQWCQESQVRLIEEKHWYKRQKQLYTITKVRWNSGPQMVLHCLKRS